MRQRWVLRALRVPPPRQGPKPVTDGPPLTFGERMLLWQMRHRCYPPDEVMLRRESLLDPDEFDAALGRLQRRGFIESFEVPPRTPARHKGGTVGGRLARHYRLTPGVA